MERKFDNRFGRKTPSEVMTNVRETLVNSIIPILWKDATFDVIFRLTRAGHRVEIVG